jgi:DNA-binding response OmpR family regulator
MKVLVVEDDPATREFVERGLRRESLDVDLAPTLREGLARARGGMHDVYVIDVMLPDGEGFELLRRLREEGTRTPALFLSARGEITDRLRGFGLGGDDYLPKPFAFAELVARIRALARRRRGEDGEAVLEVGDLVVNVRGRSARRAGRFLDLSPRQFDLLSYLMRQRGRVVSRSMIAENVWGYGFETRSNAIDVQVKQLRDRMDRGYGERLIHTVRGLGYVLEARAAEGVAGDEED